VPSKSTRAVYSSSAVATQLLPLLTPRVKENTPQSLRLLVPIRPTYGITSSTLNAPKPLFPAISWRHPNGICINAISPSTVPSAINGCKWIDRAVRNLLVPSCPRDRHTELQKFCFALPDTVVRTITAGSSSISASCSITQFNCAICNAGAFRSLSTDNFRPSHSSRPAKGQLAGSGRTGGEFS
jgi:hypothetical protein